MRASPFIRAEKALLLFVLLGALGATLGACNTTAGAGEDVSAIGHSVTRAADGAKP